ncbi:uncharacterized protein BDV14DRAFT_177878 [Aspergillus stella-maris]|uniref:uncharacterized protein n=1 Tax=Aspergillus stella-maris TaxID=1810926 RepID=UPI003CCDA4D9
MPAQRRSRRSPLECAQCTEGQMECSKARPHCDECISQRRSCRYRDQTFQQPRKAARKTTTQNSVASDSSFYSSPSPPPTEHRDSITSSTSSDSIESTSSLAKPEDPDSAEICAAVKDMSIGDQKLMENWCASTESSLTHSKNKDRSWQSVIRRESAANAALRHSVLALSAIQLASTTQDDKAKRKSHLQEAENHYRQAVDNFPAQSDDLAESGCNSVFSTASVLFMCELAFPSLAEDGRRLSTSATRSLSSSLEKEEKGEKQEQSPSPCLDRLLDLFKTIRGLSSCTKVLDVVEKGELKDLFSQSDPYHQLPSTYTLPIFAMKNLNNATAKKDSTHETEVYDDAISKLDRSLEMLSKGGEPTMIALRWMFRFPSRYLELVRERQPLALIIFAHYCAVLHHLRDRWWMDDRGSRLVKEISRLLGQERQSSILWASDIVGIQT